MAQVNFTGKTPCVQFRAHPFRRSKCTDCSYDVRDHAEAAVPEECLKVVIAEEAGKSGANVIWETEQGGCLFLGGYQASTPKFVEKKGVTHIVNAAGGLESFFVKWGKDIPEIEKKGVAFLRLGWTDNPAQRLWKEREWDQLVDAAVFIDDALQSGGKVVVHCAQGKSRSSTVVVAYLMAKRSWSLDAALSHTRSKRPMAEPNPGFHSQLSEFEVSEALRELRERLA